MQVLYSPQINEQDTLEYVFNGNIITATYNGQSDTFDFTNMPDGKATSYGRNPDIVTTLPINPVIEAEISGGVLKVQLVKFISLDAPSTDCFPDWVTV